RPAAVDLRRKEGRGGLSLSAPVALDRLVGVEISGDAEQWRADREHSSVWVADAEIAGPELRLLDLRPAPALEGGGAPYDRLARLLGAADGVAALSGPFALPRAHAASALLLWSDAARLRKGARPFGQARDLLDQYAGSGEETHWRACEALW